MVNLPLKYSSQCQVTEIRSFMKSQSSGEKNIYLFLSGGTHVVLCASRLLRSLSPHSVRSNECNVGIHEELSHRWQMGFVECSGHSKQHKRNVSTQEKVGRSCVSRSPGNILAAEMGWTGHIMWLQVPMSSMAKPQANMAGYSRTWSYRLAEWKTYEWRDCDRP